MSKQNLSLQEQLLKSGLVTQAKARSVNSDKLKQVRQQRHNNQQALDEAKELAAKIQAEKATRDRELNLKKQRLEEQKQLAGQIKQWVHASRYLLNGESDDIAYKFIDGHHIKTVYVSENLRDLIIKGRAAIVKIGQRYEAVPADVAEKIKMRIATAVIVFNENQTEHKNENDPYAGYEVPDDLIW
jgi:uncharacterized protein YaiL (DUF2058 family)